MFRLALWFMLLWSLVFVVKCPNRRTPTLPVPPPVIEVEDSRSPLKDDLMRLLKSAVNPHLSNSEYFAIANAIVDAAATYDLDPYLILGVVHAESSARVDAVNGDCLGLMQVRISIWEGVLQREGIIGTTSHSDLWTVEPAVMAGSFVLRHYLDETDGDIPSALKLYSGGAGKKYIQRATAFIKNS